MKPQFSKPSPSQRHWLPYFVLGVTLLLTGLSTYYAADTADAKDRLRFQNAVTRTQDAITKRIETYVALLRAGSGLFAASESLERDEFQAFVNHIDIKRQYPGIQGIGFSIRVTPSEVPALVASMQNQGVENFSIRPEYPRREYHAIIHLEPLDLRNQAAIGYDMFSDSTRRVAMERARDTGSPAASGGVTLVQEIDEQKQAGFLIYLPVYSTGTIPDTVAERRSTLMGFVYSPFRIDDLMVGIFGSEQYPQVDFHIYDGKEIKSNNLLYTSNHSALVTSSANPPRFTTMATLDIAGHPWSIAFASRPEIDLASGRTFVPWIFFAGVLSSFVLFMITRSLVRTRSEVEIQRSYLYSLLMQAPAAICIQRGESHIYQLANPAYRQVIGNREVMGKSVREVFPDLEGQGFFELIDNVFTTGKPFLGNEVLAALDRQANGTLEEGYFNFLYQPMYGIDGNIEGVMTFAFEVTDQVLARQQIEILAKDLQKSEERYRFLVEATTQIIWDTKAEGKFVSEQPEWSAFTGQTYEELKGWGWLNAVHPEDRDRTAKIWSEALENRSFYEIEHRLRRHDGEYRYMSVRAIPILEKDGSIREWIGIHIDITDRKQVEAERIWLLEREKAAREEAEAANRMKDEFLATLSHELRTPLNAMMGWITLLRTRNFDAARTERALETIDRNTKALAQLIEDVLDVSRIITGKLVLNVRPVELIPVIEAAIETVRPAAEAKDIQLAFTFDTPVRGILGDPNRLQQVVWNLLSNAVKFTPKGGQVRANLVIEDSKAQIQVIDTGMGIAPEFLPYVFERFRQADSSITRSQGGLGLGLAIVRHLVELQGGTVRVESPGIGQGATFIVTLPIMAVVPTTPQIEPKQHQAAANGHQPLNDSSKSVSSLEGLRILIVDDEPDARELLMTILEQYGAEVTAVGSAQEALLQLKALKDEHPKFDALVSDIGMPQEDGYSLIRKIRSLPPEQGGQIPAVALTAYAKASDRTQALLAGFQIHVPKPVDADELAVVVKQLASRQN